MPFKDPDKQREFQRLRVARRRAEFFAGKSCAVCGSTFRLELDHIDPASKTSHRIWSWSLDNMNAELSKCQILCHECHMVKSISQMPKAQHGNSKMYNKYGCRCDECRVYKSIENKKRYIR